MLFGKLIENCLKNRFKTSKKPPPKSSEKTALRRYKIIRINNVLAVRKKISLISSNFTKIRPQGAQKPAESVTPRNMFYSPIRCNLIINDFVLKFRPTNWPKIVWKTNKNLKNISLKLFPSIRTLHINQSAYLFYLLFFIFFGGLLCFYVFYSFLFYVLSFHFLYVLCVFYKPVKLSRECGAWHANANM